MHALGLPVTPQEIDRISPWRFRAALSPDIAAEREGRSIDVDTVVTLLPKRQIEQRRDILLIEGVGGVMVPLDAERTVLDVMMALQLPLILVAGSYLGTISHTLTALDALYRRGMKVMATIVSETPGSTGAARRHGGGDRALRRAGDRPAAPEPRARRRIARDR